MPVVSMRRLLLVLAFAPLPLAAQNLFPRVSVTASSYRPVFDTNVQLDPDATSAEGTRVNFERDLGLQRTESLQRFGVQWRPFARHELAGSFVSSSRRGLQQIDRDIIFRNRSYHVSDVVATGFDLDYWTATYTYWAKQSERGGFGITLGAAGLDVDALIGVQRPDLTITATESAHTRVPVALAGAQARIAFTDRLLGEATASTLPRVTFEGYTGRALTGAARLEYRPVRWLGVGASYDYFRLDVDVAHGDLRGDIGMTMRGPSGFVRLAW